MQPRQFDIRSVPIPAISDKEVLLKGELADCHVKPAGILIVHISDMLWYVHSIHVQIIVINRNSNRYLWN